MSGFTVTVKAAGNCTITATQPGNTDWQAAPAVTRTFTVIDTTPPDTTIDSGAAAGATLKTSSATFALAGSADDTAKLQCSLDGAPFADCTSPHTFMGLANGTHTAAFRAVDGAGNVDPSPAQRAFGQRGRRPAAGDTFTLPATGKAHPAKGTLTLKVQLPGAGVLSLKSAGRSPVKAATVTLLSSGVAKITIKPKAGFKLLKQSAKGKLKVHVKLTYTPTGGTANTKTYTLILK